MEPSELHLASLTLFKVESDFEGLGRTPDSLM